MVFHENMHYGEHNSWFCNMFSAFTPTAIQFLHVNTEMMKIENKTNYSNLRENNITQQIVMRLFACSHVQKRIFAFSLSLSVCQTCK